MSGSGVDRHRIRSASARDLPALHALERDIFGRNAWPLSGLAAELGPETAELGSGTTQPDDRPGGLRNGVVAVVTGEVAGYALSRRSDDVCDVVRVAVSPGFRRLGLGTALVEALVGLARDQDCNRVLLEVEAGNIAAFECYRRLGFTVIDRRLRYYADGADALVLQKVL